MGLCGKRQRNIQSRKRQQVCKGREIFVHIYQLDCFVLAGVVTPLRIGPSTGQKTLELNINVVTIVMIVKKLVFIVLILV
jgi:hypothetical protein